MCFRLQVIDDQLGQKSRIDLAQKLAETFYKSLKTIT